MIRTYRKWRALRWINEVRAMLGQEPLYFLRCGSKGDSNLCPLANSVEGATSFHSIKVPHGAELSGGQPRREAVSFLAPEVVRKFALDVDRGKYPELA